MKLKLNSTFSKCSALASYVQLVYIKKVNVKRDRYSLVLNDVIAEQHLKSSVVSECRSMLWVWSK